MLNVGPIAVVSRSYCIAPPQSAIFPSTRIPCLPASPSADDEALPPQHAGSSFCCPLAHSCRAVRCTSTSQAKVTTFAGNPTPQQGAYTTPKALRWAIPNSHKMPNMETTEQAQVRVLYEPLYLCIQQKTSATIGSSPNILYRYSAASLALNVGGFPVIPQLPVSRTVGLRSRETCKSRHRRGAEDCTSIRRSSCPLDSCCHLPPAATQSLKCAHHAQTEESASANVSNKIKTMI